MIMGCSNGSIRNVHHIVLNALELAYQTMSQFCLKKF